MTTKQLHQNEENWFEKFFLDKLNTAIRKTLSYDYEAVKKLQVYEGKIVKVELDSTPFEFFLSIQKDGIALSKYSNSEADTTIKGSPLAIFAMNMEQTVSGIKNVEIYGDANVGQFLAKWLKTVKPDWEEAWCELLGDGMGVRVSKTINSVLDFGKKFRESLVTSSKEYLVEESRDLISPTEMEQFLDDVDDLKSDVDRLEQQINLLKSTL